MAQKCCKKLGILGPPSSKTKNIEAEDMDALYFRLSAITSLLNDTVILTFQ